MQKARDGWSLDPLFDDRSAGHLAVSDVNSRKASALERGELSRHLQRCRIGGEATQSNPGRGRSVIPCRETLGRNQVNGTRSGQVIPSSQDEMVWISLQEPIHSQRTGVDR